MTTNKPLQDNVARLAPSSKYIKPQAQPDDNGKKEIIAKKPSLAPKPEVKEKPNVSTSKRIAADKAPEQINLLTFPLLNDAGKPFGTIENIEHLLKFYGVTVAYDVITKDITISIPGLKSSRDNYRNVAEAELANLAVLNGIYSANFERFVTAIASRNQVNPVMQWVESKPWDKQDRIGELCATITVADDFSNDFKDLLITKWLLSAIAAAVMPNGFSSRGVLTLQGSQGIGKTRWIARLIDDEKLASHCILLDHHMDANNKDSLINACRHWIVEFGELDSSFRKDVSRLKGFITNKEDKIRVPYARRESLFPRRSVFAATVNEDEFLVDPTGNTRWFCLPCTDINHNHDIDMQQVWAQVYEQMFKGKDSPQWWLTDQEQDILEALNSRHSKRNVVEDLLESELLFDAPKKDWVRLSASDLLKVVGIQNPTNPQARECGNFLRQRIGQPSRSQGYVRWLVPPISETLQQQEKPIHGDDDDSKY
ncbi:VapE domain-containing protein [Aliiglaciecola litoralis]|uniref:Virulence-associated protein E-like domain-containing protein n=1 Tax=Aliiglaciecola litoralis TaxID=582857 RepID=A0ABN1LPZ4_9ALTE